MKRKSFFTSSHLFVIFFAFWSTVLAVRVVILGAFLYDHTPAIMLGRWHFHHFLTGFLLLVAAVLALFLLERTKTNILVLVLGAGFGLVFDEFLYWTRFRFDYWSADNFVAVAAVGGVLMTLYLYMKRKTPDPSDFSVLALRHINPHRPAVSVVVPAYNEERFITLTLQSLCLQQFQNFELIVVDNNSTDRTADIARDFGARVVTERMQGVGYARETGFRLAQGDIIATTDADTRVPRDWLTRFVAEFDRDPELAGFGGLYRLYSGSWFSRLMFPWVIQIFWKLDRLLSGGWSLAGANMAVRREAFWRIGGFKTYLDLGEDADLSQRLRAAGRVQFDWRFLVSTSGRRFRNGLIFVLFAYSPFIFSKWVLKKERIFHPKPVRKEQPILPVALLPLFFAVILLFSLYSLNSALRVEARTVPNSAQLRHAVLKRGRVLARRFTAEEASDFRNFLHRTSVWRHRQFLPKMSF